MTAKAHDFQGVDSVTTSYVYSLWSRRLAQ